MTRRRFRQLFKGDNAVRRQNRIGRTALALALLLIITAKAFPQTVTVGGTSYQTMIGWDSLAQAAEELDVLNAYAYEYPSSSYTSYDDNFLAALLDLGVNILTVEVCMNHESGIAYDGDSCSSYGAAANDNGDANSINASGFKFERLDHQMEAVVLPYRTLLSNTNGESLFVVLRLVDYDNAGFQAEDTPNEYAEFVLAMVQRMDTQWGVTPNAVDAMNEPDQGENAGEWTAAKMADNIVQARARLDAAGYASVQIVAPSYGAGNAASSFWDSMQAANASVTASADYVSFHNYGTLMDQTQRQALRTNAAADGLGTWMNECTVAFGCTSDGSIGNLYNELVDTQVSAWMQFTATFPDNTGGGPDTDSGGKYILINTSTWAATLSNRAKYLQHYFKYVRRGAVRRSVTNSDSNFLGIPFVNTNGRYTVVIKAATSGTVAVAGLPAGTYKACVTIGNGTSAPSTYMSCGADQTLNGSNNASITFSGAGVGTVYDTSYLVPSLACRYFYTAKPAGCP